MLLRCCRRVWGTAAPAGPRAIRSNPRRADTARDSLAAHVHSVWGGYVLGNHFPERETSNRETFALFVVIHPNPLCSFRTVAVRVEGSGGAEIDGTPPAEVPGIERIVVPAKHD